MSYIDYNNYFLESKIHYQSHNLIIIIRQRPHWSPLVVHVRILAMIVLGTRRIDVLQRLAAMVEAVERRQVDERLPRLGLQVDGGTNLLEVANHLQQAPDDQEQTDNALDENLRVGG